MVRIIVAIRSRRDAYGLARRRRAPMRISFVRRTTLSLAALVLAAGSFVQPTLAASSSAASKDPCAAKTSKFAHTQCENFAHSAPADEYFGKMKLSYIGINNTFHDGTISAGAYTTDSSIINKIAFADDALHAWSSRYPGDPELARSYFLAITMFKKIYTQQYQQEAFAYMQLLTKRFPTSYFGKLEKADLSRGFTEHWFALPQICPTPLPLNQPVPETTPAGRVPPSPAPGQPKIDIITPPCVQPSPVPTETPFTAETPLPTQTPTSTVPLVAPSATP
jgi:hypothetical protein